MKSSKNAPALVDGFDPGNVDRIYRGQPALSGGQIPEDVLSRKVFEVMSMATAGSNYRQIADGRSIGISTVRSQLHTGYGRLGVVAKQQLAGFFPIEEGAEILEGKRLEDLGQGAALNILEDLSVGGHYGQIALSRSISLSTVRTHMHNLNEAWAETNGGLQVLRVANGIRAGYLQAIMNGMTSIELADLGTPTLMNVAEAEPELVRQIEAFKAVDDTVPGAVEDGALPGQDGLAGLVEMRAA